MRIVVLVKPVPDPASAGERLGPDGRLDRPSVPAVVNGNDEYALEAALKLVEAAGGGEVTLLSMAPPNAPETLRKALAMGATRGVHVTDPALAGSCAVSTARVLAAALRDSRIRPGPGRRRHFGRRRWRRAGGDRRPSRAAVPVHAARIEPDEAAGTVRVRRISPTGYDLLEAPMPARHRVHPGPRRAALPVAQGDHGRPIQGDRHAVARGPGLDPADGRRRGRDDGRPRDRDAAGPRRDRGRPREPADEGARQDRRVPRRRGGSSDGRDLDRRRTGADGGLARISAEAATLARELGRRPVATWSGSSSRADRSRSPQELAGTCRLFGPWRIPRRPTTPGRPSRRATSPPS